MRRMSLPTTRTFLTVDEAAEILGLHVRTVYKLVADGEIPSVRFGGSIRIPRDKLLALGDIPSPAEAS